MLSYISKLKLTVVTAAILISAFVLNSPSRAVELVISGNGSSADSQINITSTTTTTVEQVNHADIQNNVHSDLNTGANNASDNTNAGTSVTTGNISSETSIQNSTNSSSASVNCCPQPSGNIAITDNATGSQNTVNLNQNTNTQITISQNAQIQNNIVGTANTGGNSANENTRGNTSISTGNISVNSKTANDHINKASVSDPQEDNSLQIKISGNGSSSNSQVNITSNNNLNLSIDNKAEILNNSIWDLITGKNQANGNTGGTVSVVTGSINLVSEIINDPINSDSVTIPCCKTKPGDGGQNPPPGPSEKPKGGPPETPQPQPASQSQPPSSAGPGPSPQGGEVLAAETSGQILPATGVSWTIILTLASLIMFMLGLYLRLHPGCDPGKITTHV